MDFVQLRGNPSVVSLPCERLRTSRGDSVFRPNRSNRILPELPSPYLRKPAPLIQIPCFASGRIDSREVRWLSCIVDPFPEKPKGMHWRTYQRLQLEAARAEMRFLSHL